MNQLQHYRKKAGLSQAALAEQMKDKHKSTISNYEQGRRNISIPVAQEIIGILKRHGVKITIDDLCPPMQDQAA